MNTRNSKFPRSNNDKLPRTNEYISSPSVRVVDEEGDMLGVMPTEQALELAKQRGLDLVEISPNAEPPVCKIIDFGKYKYEEQKRANDAKKKQKTVQVKEVKVRPNIGDHDYQVKIRSIEKFISAGNKVKVSLRFRGREITHQDIAIRLMERIIEDIQEFAKAEVEPKMEGRQLAMILVGI